MGKKKKYWIKSGVKVANMVDLDRILTVNGLKYRKTRNRNTHVEYVLCSEVVDGRTEYSKHHTRDLVPEKVAKQGVMKSYEFINN